MPAEVIQIQDESDIKDAISRASAILKDGGVVVYPTDTSYGIGCDPRISDALNRLIEIKHRDPSRGIPLLFASLNQCMEFHEFNDLELAIGRLFWPGALTLVVTTIIDLPQNITGRHKSVAIRVPDHNIPRGIAHEIGGPIVGTSANRSGGPSPFDLSTARDQLGDEVDLYIDAGESEMKKNSTIIGVEEGTPANIRIFREGAISIEQLSKTLKADTDVLQYWTARLIIPEM